MPIVYVDFRTAPVDGAEHISEFTWASESYGDLEPHHYFVNYPGAKDFERQLIEVVGGSTFVRYSCMIVLKAFVDSLEEGYIIATKTGKQKRILSSLLNRYDLGTGRAICVFGDVSASEEEEAAVLAVIEVIESARSDAARKFGNSL